MSTNTEPGFGPAALQGSSSRNDASSSSSSSSVRRVLGEMSPNIRASAVPPNSSHLTKPMAGSPLKRSFTAAMEGNGFKYFKKRKMSSEDSLHQQQYPSHSHESGKINRNAASVGHAHPAPAQVPVPKIETSYPTEPNTPTSEDGDDHGGVERSSTERRSFSSLINYDPSSQPLGSQQRQQQQDLSRSSGLVFNGPSHAELLRLRLKVAMFKVRTNQVTVPFEKLEPEAKLSTSVAVEGAVALLRDQAREKMAQVPALAANPMLAAPVLKPTEYSSRMVYGPAITSSPPPPNASLLAQVLPSLGSGEMTATPARRYNVPDEAELTSSIVKGRVAEGLLGLRHGFGGTD